MHNVSQSIYSVSFSQVLAEVLSEQQELGSAAMWRGTERLCCKLAILAVGQVPRAPSSGSRSGYSDACARVAVADRLSTMIEATRRLETALVSSFALSADELRRLRREAAMAVHPDLCTGPDKQVAEELMKTVNALVAAALESRSRQ